MNLNKFHKDVKIFDNCFDNLYIENNQFVFNNFSFNSSEHHELEKNKISFIVKYISEFSSNLNKSDVKHLESIQIKISNSGLDKTEISEKIELMKQFIKIAQQTPSSLKRASPPSSIVLLRLASRPSNKEELLFNLSLIRENYPRYQLGNDLSVYDASYRALPEGHNRAVIRQQLATCIQKYHVSNDDSDASLVNLIAWMKNELIEVKQVQVAIMIETNQTENGGLYSYSKEAIHRQIPLILTHQLFFCHKYGFKDLFKLCDIYFSPNCRLIIALPKGQFPASHGFFLDDSQRILDVNQLDNQPVDFTPFDNNEMQKLIVEEIQSLLINQQDDCMFMRSPFLSGHATTGRSIAGLSIPIFQQLLDVFKSKNTNLLFMSSCYAPGVNRLQLHPRNSSQIPFPIVMQGAFELSVREETAILEKWDKINELVIKKLRDPVSFGKITRREIDALLKNFTHILANYPTYLLPGFSSYPLFLHPSHHPDILNIDACLQEKYKQTIDACLQKKYKRTLERKESDPSIITDLSGQKTKYFFSSSIIPGKIVISQNKAITFLSPGEASHHIIQEISAPHLSLEETLTNTFNAFDFDVEDLDNSKIKLNKVYAIGKMHCQFQGKEVRLHSLIIEQNINSCRCLFVIDQEGKEEIRSLHFDLNRSAVKWGLSQKIETLSLKQMVAEVYSILISSGTVSNSNHSNRRTGLESKDLLFYQAFKEYFWNSPLSSEIQLFQLAIESSLTNIILDHCSNPFKNFQIVFKNYLQQSNQLEDADEIKNTYQFLSKLRIEVLKIYLGFPFADFIETECLTPLTQAIKSKFNDVEEVGRILKEAPHLINIPTISGETPLYSALISGQYKVVQLLIQMPGVKLHISNQQKQSSSTDILIEAISTQNQQLIEICINSKINDLKLDLLNFQDLEGNTIFYHALKHQNFFVMDHLIKVGIDLSMKNKEVSIQELLISSLIDSIKRGEMDLLTWVINTPQIQLSNSNLIEILKTAITHKFSLISINKLFERLQNWLETDQNGMGLVDEAVDGYITNWTHKDLCEFILKKVMPMMSDQQIESLIEENIGYLNPRHIARRFDLRFFEVLKFILDNRQDTQLSGKLSYKILLSCIKPSHDRSDQSNRQMIARHLSQWVNFDMLPSGDKENILKFLQS